MAESTARLCRFVDLEGLGEVKSAERRWSKEQQDCGVLSRTVDFRTREEKFGPSMSLKKASDRTLVGTRVGLESISWPEQSADKSLYVTIKAIDFGGIENRSLKTEKQRFLNYFRYIRSHTMTS